MAGSTGSSVDIRRAGTADAAALTGLVERYWEFEGIQGFEAHRVERLLQALLRDPTVGLGWVAWLDDQPVGYLLAVLVFSLEHGGRMAEIDEFFVLGPARAAGVGRRLLAAAEAALTAIGCVRVQLQLGTHNIAAREFYRRHGYLERDGYELLDKPL